MANEYLTRTPTSSGNRKVFTISAWAKLSSPSTIMCNAESSGANNGFYFSFTGDNIYVGTYISGWQWFIRSKAVFRDKSSWQHLMVSIDTTKVVESERVRLYINGNEITDYTAGYTYPAINYDTLCNTNDKLNAIGRWGGYDGGYLDASLFDYFHIDGQALTPDVFGFYKDGDGYMSSGTGEATDFRPGQWMPHSPTKIKKDVNRRGGFGANGFYLPMNDSSNPGADFHCAPNSIIKLKGEDLPQPRNGAPTTSDAYVSQLRPEVSTLGFDGVVAFDGTGDYLTPPGNTDFTLGTGDFTIECWVYPKTYGGIFQFFDSSILDNSTSGPSIGIDVNDNSWAIRYGASSTLDTTNIATLNVWSHIAYVRNSSVTRLYVNGEEIGSVSDSTDYSANYPVIGGWYNTSFLLNGFISNFRVVKGTAVYTANFTAPTEPLTNVTNTKLLCCNSTTSATAATVTPGTITAAGDVFATKNELTGSTVLAVPGVSIDFITNGTFDSNTTGWTASNAVISAVDGKLKVDDSANAGGWSNAFYVLTTVAGRTYNLEVDVLDGNEDRLIGIYQGTYTANSATAPSTTVGTYSSDQKVTTSFTATGTSVSIMLIVNNNGVVYFDNVKVYDTTPRDYSADIKGSGTNKTLTANNSAGVAGDLGGYYGSAMTFDGTTDSFQISVPNNDPLFLQSDFTIECWANIAAGQTDDRYFLVLASGASSNADGSYYLRIFQSKYQGIFVNSNNQYQTNSTNNYVANQWNHIAYVREGNQQSLYINGVCESVTSHTLLPNVNNSSFLYIGSSYGLNNSINAQIQDVRIHDGVAKYKGGFDVPKPYTPVGIEAFRTVADTCKNNFATFNPLRKSSNQTLSDGNLTCTQAGQVWGAASSNIGMDESSGKYYVEYRVASNTYSYIGIANADSLVFDLATVPSGYSFMGATANDWGYLSSSGGIQHNNSNLVSGGAILNTGDILGITFDTSNKEAKWYANGVLQYTTTLTGNYPFFFASGSYQSSNIANFGQNPSFSGQVTAGTNADDSGKGLFKYAPPTGFLALCEDNLPTPAIADPGEHFKSVLYNGRGTSGTDGSQSIRKVGFQPDLVWVKKRGTAGDHKLIDSVRGVALVLESNTTDAEGNENNNFTGFNSDGFDLGANNAGAWNESAYGYVAWCWKAGGAAVSNTDGSVTSQVSVNQTAGFSIVSYTGTGAAISVGHGLEKAPAFMISKNRSISRNWPIYHQSTSNTGTSAADVVYLDLSLVGSSDNFTSVNDTTFSTTTWNGVSGDGNAHIAYCWTEIEGYSKFGKYTGNGSNDGSFVYCGFKPAWVLVKNISTTSSHWILWDSSRTPTNLATNALSPNNSWGDTSNFDVDLLSNGFKLRDAELSLNDTSDTYIFAAFAESPFQTANAK